VGIILFDLSTDVASLDCGSNFMGYGTVLSEGLTTVYLKFGAQIL